MTPAQIDMLFSNQLVTVGMLKGLAKQKYGAKDKDICLVFVTRKSMCDQEDFVVRTDDCVKISMIKDGELVLYKHGSARAVLGTWNLLSPTEVITCSKCMGG